MYEEERHVLEMRKVVECDMEKFSALDISEKTMAMLGNRWWPLKAKQKGGELSKTFLRIIWKRRTQ